MRHRHLGRLHYYCIIIHVSREPEQAASPIAVNALENLVECQLMTNPAFHNRIIVFGVPNWTNFNLRWYPTNLSTISIIANETFFRCHKYAANFVNTHVNHQNLWLFSVRRKRSRFSRANKKIVIWNWMVFSAFFFLGKMAAEPKEKVVSWKDTKEQLHAFYVKWCSLAHSKMLNADMNGEKKSIAVAKLLVFSRTDRRKARIEKTNKMLEMNGVCEYRISACALRRALCSAADAKSEVRKHRNTLVSEAKRPHIHSFSYHFHRQPPSLYNL